MASKSKPKMWKGNSKASIIWPGKQTNQKNYFQPMDVISVFPLNMVFLVCMVIRLMFTVLELRAELAKTRSDLNWAEEQIARFNREKFVGKSQICNGQIVMDQIFQYFEKLGNDVSNLIDVDFITVTSKRRRHTKRGQNLTTLLYGIVNTEQLHYYPEVKVCPECERQYDNIGVGGSRKTLKVIPAQIRIVEEIQHTYSCSYCNRNSTSAHVVTAKLPPALLPGSMASPDIVSYIAFQKYEMGSPIYRIEKEFYFLGVQLSRMTMNSWVNDCAALLNPLMDRMHAYLLREEVLMGDETTLSVLSLYPDHHPRKSYIWLVRTARFAEHQLVLYRFENSREYYHHKDFIHGFRGFFQCDGYGAYSNDPDITYVRCFAHARGKFVDAVKNGRSQDTVSYAQAVVTIFDKMFQDERSFSDASPEERLSKRLSLVRPRMDSLRVLLDKLEPIVVPKSLLGKAIAYTRNQWDLMMNVFLDGRLELSNNMSERSMKSYVISRKNFLFSVTEEGARAGATYLSLFESAIENGLDPIKYVTMVLSRIRTIDSAKPENYDALLPWYAPENCKTLKYQKGTSQDPESAQSEVAAS